MDNILSQETENKEVGIFYKYALTLVDVPGLGSRTFSYSIPEELKNSIKIGLPILVPFGAKGAINAFVVAFSNYIEEGIKVKPILEILDTKEVFSLEYLNILEWISKYYCCDLNTVLQASIPMKFFKQSKRVVKKVSQDTPAQLLEDEIRFLCELSIEKNVSIQYLQKKTKFSYSKFYKISKKLQNMGLIKVENIVEDNSHKAQLVKFIKYLNSDGATNRQKIILELLKLKGDYIPLIEFEKEVATTRPTIIKIQSLGFVDIIEREKFRNPLDIFNIENKDSFPELSEPQQSAFDVISKKIDSNQTDPILLFGVTASGKTEVYFKAIQKVLSEGKNVLFLAPEIALASQLTMRLARRFGTDHVALWHSSISEGEKYDVWQKLRNDEVRILAGARSAVFAPLKNIGLIIIDEEHEGSYKQNTPAPRYNAKTVAEKIAQQYGAAIILGSATPEISTFYRALNTNNLVTLGSRFNNVPMASVIVVDMREEFFKESKSIFSRTLISEIDQTINRKQQVILLMNRRGFSTHTLCLNCGETIKCSNCDIPMVWHSTEDVLKCHWCNKEEQMPKSCPSCGSSMIKSYGIGTQRVEAIVQKLFPDAKVARMDSDMLSSKTAHVDVLKNFESGEIDILIGTQMIAKGLDNKNVTLVGVINSDSSFNLPDYRASERGFQLLTQVAGRSGRGDFSGKVIFQTYNPDFYAIENAREQNYEKFYNEEIVSREIFDYPPFSQVIKLVVSSSNTYRAEKSAQEIALRLNNLIEKHSISERLIVLGPSTCILEKINNEYRFQIIIKNKMETKGLFFITTFVNKITMPNDIKLTVDVDPIDIL